MRSVAKLWSTLLASTAVIILILDTKTAYSGAFEGIELCLRTVVPSLFPFFVISSYLNSRLAGVNLRFLSPLAKLCKLPAGSEPLLLLGFIGGYPVGAQNIMQSYENKVLSLQTAQRMTLFCNNAGPAFLFGMAASVFSKGYIPWVLWAIHIFTAVLIATALPKQGQVTCETVSAKAIPLTTAMEKALRSMVAVCGWVVIFRVLLSFMIRWFGFMLTPEVQVFLIGFFELANGCSSLSTLSCEGLRFVLCAFFLGFGGLCVTMQTQAICKILPIKLYICCKLLHGTSSMLLAYFLQFFLFSSSQRIHVSPLIVGIAACFMLIFPILMGKRKKVVAIPC